MCLSAVLRELGRVDEADSVLEDVRSVNPVLANTWMTEVCPALGLDEKK